MTERHNEPAGTGRPISTGEFRAAPDISASTAQFQAFAAADKSAPAQQWDETAASDRSPARIALLIAGVVIVLAIIAILGATLG